jgi:hypothetical protein
MLGYVTAITAALGLSGFSLLLSKPLPPTSMLGSDLDNGDLRRLFRYAQRRLGMDAKCAHEWAERRVQAKWSQPPVGGSPAPDNSGQRLKRWIRRKRRHDQPS